MFTSPNSTDMRFVGTKLGEVIDMAKDNPLPIDDQTINPRNPNGRKGKESGTGGTRLKRGGNPEYTLRRLARDNPELLDKIEAGELSVNQAAIKDDAECLAMFRQAMKEQGRRTDLPNNVREVEAVCGNRRKDDSRDRISMSTNDRSNTYTLRRLARDCPESTQQRIADEVGVSQQYAHEVLSSKKSDSDKTVDIPLCLQSRTDQADYRKLPMDMREAVKVGVNAYFHSSTIAK
jgi:hypothetical protein